MQVLSEGVDNLKICAMMTCCKLQFLVSWYTTSMNLTVFSITTPKIKNKDKSFHKDNTYIVIFQAVSSHHPLSSRR